MKKFFILGCPRSGTTMLQQALNRHSQIVIPPETRYFSAFLGHSKRQQQKHVERLNHDLQISLPALRRRVAGDDDARAFFDLMTSQYTKRLGRREVAYFGEKSPAHTGHLWKINQLFPKAKIIFIYRDGRDVALSLTKVPWTRKDIYVNFTMWIYYSSILEQARQGNGLDLLCVKYEDLATNPRSELGKVLDFLHLDYETKVAAQYGNSEGIPKHEYGWKARALERISSDRIGVWRDKLSQSEIGILERLGGKTLRSLGYPLMTDGRADLTPGFCARLAWNLLGLASGLPYGLIANELVERLARSPLSSFFNGSSNEASVPSWSSAAEAPAWKPRVPAHSAPRAGSRSRSSEDGGRPVLQGLSTASVVGPIESNLVACPQE